MALPKITQSELLRRWQGANELSWEVYSIYCSDCGKLFETGDVNFTFPAPTPEPTSEGEVPAIARKMPLHRCTTCTWDCLRRGIRFDGVAVFVEKQHQGRTLDELPLEIQGKLLESFTVIDRLSQQLEAASRGRVPPEPS